MTIKVTREFQNRIITYIKDNGLFVFVNSWNQAYVFSTKPIKIDWLPNFDPNLNSLPCLLDENDYSLIENLFFSSVKDESTDTYKTKCSSPWRYNDVTRYYTNIKEEYGKSYYDKFGTRLVCLDSILSTLPQTEKDLMKTISIYGCKIFNIPCLAFGNEVLVLMLNMMIGMFLHH